MADSPLPVVHMTAMLEEVTATGERVEGATPAPERYGVQIVPMAVNVEDAAGQKMVHVKLQALWDDEDDSSYISFTTPRAGYWALIMRNDQGDVAAQAGPQYSPQDKTVLFPREG